jgi:hypothetical protein
VVPAPRAGAWPTCSGAWICARAEAEAEAEAEEEQQQAADELVQEMESALETADGVKRAHA